MTPDPTPDRGHVLVVEDEPMLRSLLFRLLSREGYLVTLTGDATEAFREIDAQGDHAFDVVYLDLTLPGVPGAAALARLRAEHPSMPVVLTSGRDARGIPTHVLEAATEFLPKPFDADELVVALERARAARRDANRFVA
jgi:two-component system, OmpR family, phosphate regulon response regulator OmpR